MLMRVAERPLRREGKVRTVILDPEGPGGLRVLEWDADDPQLDTSDPRGIGHGGDDYLTTLSHLRLAWS